MSDVLKYKLSQGTASLRRVYFTCVDTTDVSSRLQASDMSTFTVELSANGGTPAVPGGSTVTEVSSSLAKGLFYVTPNAADIAAVGRYQLIITNAGGTKAMRFRIVNFIVGAEDGSDTATSNITQVSGTVIGTPTTAGYLRTDTHALEAGVITAASIASGALTLAKFAADILLSGFGILDSGVCQAGSSSTTLKLRAAASAVNGAYVNGGAMLISGTGAMQAGSISAYVGATQLATMGGSWTTTPDTTTNYVIYGFASSGGSGSVSAATLAAAVWSQALVGSAQAGDLMRLMLALLAGPANGYDTGAPQWKCPITGKIRASGTTDATGRLTTTLGDLT